MLPYLERPFSGLDTSIRVEDDIPVWGEGVLDPSVMTSERRFTHALRKSWSWTRTRLPSRRLVIVFVTLHIGTLLAAV